MPELARCLCITSSGGNQIRSDQIRSQGREGREGGGGVVFGIYVYIFVSPTLCYTINSIQYTVYTINSIYHVEFLEVSIVYNRWVEGLLTMGSS